MFNRRSLMVGGVAAAASSLTRIAQAEAQLPEELVFYEDYLGERDATFTLNFSGSSALIL